MSTFRALPFLVALISPEEIPLHTDKEPTEIHVGPFQGYQLALPDPCSRLA